MRDSQLIVFFFFFQAEDGIRYGTVTGVQTCALPISSAIQLAPPSVVRSSEPPPAAQPCWPSMKSTWLRAAAPAYCRVQLAPPSLVAMMRPAPATQPWPESVNWTAASAGDWPDPDPESGEA